MLSVGLASVMPNGKSYERRADVEAEIETVWRLPESEWMAAAQDLQSETLVFLIRRIRGGDEEVAGHLVQELSKRTVRLVERWTSGLGPIAAETIASQVEIEVLELVLGGAPSRQSDFLEVAFRKAVARRTIDAVRKHNNSAMGRRCEIVAGVADHDAGDDIERPLELVVDDRPGPETILLQLQDEALRSEWIRKACDAVKDPRRLEAVILHYGYEWPITSKDPDKPDLARRFNATPRQIKYWIAKALEAMRAAMGDDHDQF